MSPAPESTSEVLAKSMLKDTTKIVSIPKDTTKIVTNLKKYDDLRKLQKTYDIQQKNVMEQIQILEKQQETLDSLLKKK